MINDDTKIIRYEKKKFILQSLFGPEACHSIDCLITRKFSTSNFVVFLAYALNFSSSWIFHFPIPIRNESTDQGRIHALHSSIDSWLVPGQKCIYYSNWNIFYPLFEMWIVKNNNTTKYNQVNCSCLFHWGNKNPSLQKFKKQNVAFNINVKWFVSYAEFNNIIVLLDHIVSAVENRLSKLQQQTKNQNGVRHRRRLCSLATTNVGN